MSNELLQHPSKPIVVLSITTAAVFIAAFASSSLNVALPPIGAEFHIDGITLNWVVTSFVLTSAIFLLPLGRLGDIHGRKRVFVVGMALYCLSSLVAFFAQDAFVLIAARALTGVGAGASFSTVTAILVASYPPEKRGRVLGINIASVYFGLSAGPFIGGLLTNALGWRSLFLVHAGASLIVVIMIFWKMKGDWHSARDEKIDWVGALIYAFSLSALLVGFSELPQIQGIILASFGILGLVGFVLFENRKKSPLLDLSVIKGNRIITFSGLAAMFSYSATFSVAFLLSLYLEVVKGLPPHWAGLILVAQPVVQAIFSPLTGRLSDRIQPSILASSGMAITALGLFTLIFLDRTTSEFFVLGGLFLLGLGFALFSSPNTNAIMGSVDKKDLGVASALLATVRVVGQMMSMAMALVLFSLLIGKVQISTGNIDQFLGAQRWGFSIAAGLCFLGIFASLARGKVKKAEA